MVNPDNTSRARRARQILVAGAIPLVLAIAAGTASASEPQPGVTPQAAPGQAGVSPQGGTQQGVTPAPAPKEDAASGLAAAIPDPPPPRPDRPMPNFWPDPSWPTRTEPAVYEDTPAEDDTEEPAQPPAPPELTLHLGADSVARPADVPESLVAEWNRVNDRIVYELALAGDAAGLPRDQADRRAAVTAGGAVAGASVGANAAGFVAGLGGCFTGMLIGGVAGAAIGGIPTAGVAGPLGATIGGVGGCMVGAAVLGVPATVAGGVVGAIVGGAVAGAAGSGTSDAPPTDVAPAPEPEPSADVDPACERETQPGENDGVPVAAPLPDPASPLSPVDAFVSTVVTTAQAVWAQLTAPPVPEHIFNEG